MKKISLSLLITILSLISTFSQTPTPTVSATPKTVDKDDDIVKISTTLIQVDVTVTDKNGKIVRNLQPEDFEIYENGKKQEITNFSFISSVSETNQDQIIENVKNNKVKTPVPPIALRPEQVRRTIAIVVDNINMSFDGIHYTRRALKKFVDEQMQPNDLVAIICTDGGVGAMQQFTSDKNQLYAAINNVRWNVRGGMSAFLAQQNIPVVSTNKLQRGKIEKKENSSNSQVLGTQETKNINNLKTGGDEFWEESFALRSLEVISFIVKGMRELPGRKAVMLFSDGFPAAKPGEDDRVVRLAHPLSRLAELSNRSAVTIYAQDARGMVYTGITARDEVGTKSGIAGEILSTRSQEIRNTQDGLIYLAEQTGGQAIINSTEPNKGLEKLLEENKGYYLIAYQPDSDTFDAKTRKFNKLEVKIKQSGLNVRSRSGFFNVVDSKDKTSDASSSQTPVQQMLKSLISPFSSNKINLRLNALFGSDSKNSLFVHSILNIQAKDLNFVDTPDGFKKAEFDIIAASFGANGIIVDQINKTYALEVKGETYKNILKDGFIYSVILPIKKSGAYQMRVVIRDKTNANIGSATQYIEVPDLKKGNLALSGIMLENVDKERNTDIQITAKETLPNQRTNPLQDTSLRRFKRGTFLRYNTEIYNAGSDKTNKPNLSTQIRIFCEGKMILEGKTTPFDSQRQIEPGKNNFTGALNLGASMQPGDYILQIIVTDNLQKESRNLATQFVQFEVIE